MTRRPFLAAAPSAEQRRRVTRPVRRARRHLVCRRDRDHRQERQERIADRQGLKNSSLTGADLRAESVNSDDVQNGSLLGADFAPVQLPQGPKGDTGAKGEPGSNATINGVAAGGDLAGSFPNPTIAAGAVTTDKLAPGIQEATIVNVARGQYYDNNAGAIGPLSGPLRFLVNCGVGDPAPDATQGMSISLQGFDTDFDGEFHGIYVEGRRSTLDAPNRPAVAWDTRGHVARTTAQILLWEKLTEARCGRWWHSYTESAMPIYEYRCERGHTFEVMQRMTDDPIELCEEHGTPVQRVFHPVAVHFKGSGFYNTDYGKKKTGAASEGKAESSSDSSKKSDSGSGSSDSSSSSSKDSSSKPASNPAGSGTG